MAIKQSFVLRLVALLVFSVDGVTLQQQQQPESQDILRLGAIGQVSNQSRSLQARTSTWRSPVVKQEAIDQVNYGVVVDCGSSGTRATIYTWPRGTQPGQLAYRIKPLERNGQLVSVRIRPGLASTRDNPNYASDYMRPIMDFAAREVPRGQQASTPVYIMGTAGMRLLTGDEQRAILNDLRRDLARDYPAFGATIQAEVISGLEEGAFQWVSSNALARRLQQQFDLPRGGAKSLLLGGGGNGGRRERRRLALVEMGGASSQVAFEVGESLNELQAYRLLKHNSAAWRVYRTSGMDLNLYGDAANDVSVFSVSFLGFGSDTARSLAIDLLVRDSLKQLPIFLVATNSWQQHAAARTGLPLVVEPNGTFIIQDPCLPTGAQETVQKPLDLIDGFKLIGYNAPRSLRGMVNIKLLGRASYAKCQHLLNRLALVAKHEQTTCNMARNDDNAGEAVKQSPAICEAPLIGTNFVPWKEFQFIGLGELFYTSSEMFNSTAGPFNAATFQHKTARLCSTQWEAIQFQYPPRNDFEVRRNLLACFKATWILTWLITILRMPPKASGGGGAAHVDLTITNRVATTEVDWKLGAIITRTIGANNPA